MADYTIGEAAGKLGIAPSALRYYDKEGLLPFVERSAGGIRIFRKSDFEWLSIIECLKKTGMPIKEIRKFIDLCIEGDSTIKERKELIEKRREAVSLQIRQLEEILSVLDYKKWYYEAAEKAGTCSIHNNMEEEDIPPELRDAWKRLKGLHSMK